MPKHLAVNVMDDKMLEMLLKVRSQPAQVEISLLNRVIMMTVEQIGLHLIFEILQWGSSLTVAFKELTLSRSTGEILLR